MSAPAPSPAWKGRTAAFLISQGITLFGSSLTQFAIVWYVTLETSSGTVVSALTLCSFLPQMLISFPAGVWADRFSRKKIIIAADAAIALCTLALALLLPRLDGSRATLAALLAVSALRAVGAGIQTPAVNAVLPQLAPPEALMRLNGINAALQSAVQFAAPAAAGALLSVSTLTAALLVDVGTAVVGIGLLGCLALPRVRAAQGDEAPSMLADMKRGVCYARGNRFLGALLLCYGAYIFLCVPSGFQATLFVTRTYGESYLYLTLTEVIGFAGMTLGGLIVGAWGGFANRARSFAAGLFAFGALGAAMGLVRSFAAYLSLMVALGVALTLVQTAVTTLLQQKTEAAMQGRMFGFLNIVYSGFLPLGMAVFGPLADAVSMRLLMAVSGALLMALGAALRLNRRFLRAGLPDAQRA